MSKVIPEYRVLMDALGQRAKAEMEWAIEDYNRYAKHLKNLYDESERVIKRNVMYYLNRIGNNEELSLDDLQRKLLKDELKEFRMSVQDYIRFASKNGLNDTLIKKLKTASLIHRIDVEKALYYDLNMNITKLFYKHKQDSMDTLVNVYKHANPYMVGINHRKLEIVMENAFTPNGKYKNVLQNSEQKFINRTYNELLKNIAGRRKKIECLESISKEFNISYRASCAVFDTVHSYATNKANEDMYKELEIEKYQIIAVMDEKTTDTCRHFNLKVYDFKDYKVGITAPPFHYRCRTTTRPFFNDAIQEDIIKNIQKYRNIPAYNDEIEKELDEKAGKIARNPITGKTEHISNMKYDEWYKRYVDGETDALTKVSVKDTIKGDVSSGALNPNSKEASKHAFQYYESVRKMKTDCEAIAQKTGYAIAFVQEVKNHLFMTKHDLGNGVPEYFFPDYEISQSWQRLMDSKMEIQPHDLILLEHEHAEYLYMQNGLTQEEAHRKAEEKFNYAEALKERK